MCVTSSPSASEQKNSLLPNKYHSAIVMALRQIQSDYKNLMKEPVEGFLCVPDEENFFAWTIYIEGPKDTPFAGGIFELNMSFPKDYPMSPPALRFVSDFWHPNVYKDGKVCISILHPPGADLMSGELPEERWLPTQTVSTIILSVLSILGDPNLSSPANIDASVCWRDDRKKFTERVAKLIEKSNARIPKDIKIPHPESNPEERQAVIQKRKEEQNRNDLFEDDGGEDDFELCSDFPDDDLVEEVVEDETPKATSEKPKKPSARSSSSHHKSRSADKKSSSKKDDKPRDKKTTGTEKKEGDKHSKKRDSSSVKKDSEKNATDTKKPSDKPDKKSEKKSAGETVDKKTDKKLTETSDSKKEKKTDEKRKTKETPDKKPHKESTTSSPKKSSKQVG